MKIEKGVKIREGKAKILYEARADNQDCVIQYFKDDATAFNALKKGTIKDKGIINNAVSSWIFSYLEKKGIPTHFIQKYSEREMLVKRVTIIPVETVVRNRAAGSICKRLGFEKGKAFHKPLVEYFYKSDELGDPQIGETHIYDFGWATPSELSMISDLALRVNEILKWVFNEVGLELIDFKLEFGKEYNTNKIILADEFTPDGSRLWDLKTGESMDKDRFRQDLGKVDESYLEVYQRLETFFKDKV